jgi:uncharacterized protein
MKSLISRFNPGFKQQAASTKNAAAYSLKDGEVTSTHYYSDIAAFADYWSSSLHPVLDELIDKVCQLRAATGLAERSFDELALELLALGVALHEHSAEAARFPAWGKKWLETMIHLQAKYPRFEGLFKTLRGGMNILCSFGRGAKDHNVTPTSRVRQLVDWLRLQGSEPQANRLEEWVLCLAQAEPPSAASLLDSSLELARRFDVLSEASLGTYTRGVEAYRSRVLPTAHWRYDALLVSSTALEYHLGMLATEILNRVYHPGFMAAPHKLVILPPCLCARPQGECIAIQTPLGVQCGGCTPACQVNQISKAAALKGVRVVMVPDDQLSSLCLASGQSGTGLGVIGASCALRNWSAGWEANRLGLNAHGVLLDSAGCSKHWTKNGVPTDVNLQELFKQL